jgi:hypothetical protein
MKYERANNANGGKYDAKQDYTTAAKYEAVIFLFIFFHRFLKE